MFYWPNIQKFQSWQEKADEGGSGEEEGEEVEGEGEVSYSVSGDLQVT